MGKTNRIRSLFVSSSLLRLPAIAKTPNGETPANEEICNGLMTQELVSSMRISFIAVLATVGIFGSTGIASAAVILNPPGHLDTELSVRGYRNADGAWDTLFPTSACFIYYHEHVNVDEFSSASYDFNQNRFNIEFTHIGNSARSVGGTTIRDGSVTYSSIRFAVDTETPYYIVGYYDADGLRRKSFYVELSDASGGTQYLSRQDSQPQTPTVEHFVVGGAEGDTFNQLVGSQSGMLQPDVLYSFWLEAFIENLHPAPPGTAVGSGSVTLFFGPVPVPPAAWLFGSALGLLAWMRRKAA